jgi:hypothetical protein
VCEKKESGKENEEITEKEIDRIIVATKNVTIPNNNVSITSCALESFCQREVSEENRNSTKEKEVEKMENCERNIVM